VGLSFSQRNNQKLEQATQDKWGAGAKEVVVLRESSFSLAKIVLVTKPCATFSPGDSNLPKH